MIGCHAVVYKDGVTKETIGHPVVSLLVYEVEVTLMYSWL